MLSECVFEPLSNDGAGLVNWSTNPQLRLRQLRSYYLVSHNSETVSYTVSGTGTVAGTGTVRAQCHAVARIQLIRSLLGPLSSDPETAWARLPYPKTRRVWGRVVSRAAPYPTLKPTWFGVGYFPELPLPYPIPSPLWGRVAAGATLPYPRGPTLPFWGYVFCAPTLPSPTLPLPY